MHELFQENVMQCLLATDCLLTHTQLCVLGCACGCTILNASMSVNRAPSRPTELCPLFLVMIIINTHFKLAAHNDKLCLPSRPFVSLTKGKSNVRLWELHSKTFVSDCLGPAIDTSALTCFLIPQQKDVGQWQHSQHFCFGFPLGLCVSEA